MKRHTKIAMFLFLSLLFGFCFWFACEDRLKFDVYAGETLWYDEPFNMKAKIVITAVVGLASGLLATAVCLLASAAVGRLKAKGRK
jgi:ABC-type spermidine/putrescine transport system permease subunit II